MADSDPKLRPLWQRYFAIIAYLLSVALLAQILAFALSSLKVFPSEAAPPAGQPFKLLLYSVVLQIASFLLPVPLLLKFTHAWQYRLSVATLRDVVMCVASIFLSMVAFSVVYHQLGIETKQLAIIDGKDIVRHSIAFVFLTAFAVPLYEEWIFRGVIFGLLVTGETSKRRALAAGFFCALLFTAVHYEGKHSLSALPPIFVMATIFQYMTWRSGSILPAVLGHAFQNFLASTALLAKYAA